MKVDALAGYFEKIFYARCAINNIGILHLNGRFSVRFNSQYALSGSLEFIAPPPSKINKTLARLRLRYEKP